ncbi:MAG: hypothetical protein HY682_04015 [Chloroflexi bacterium]|nr:hypothetical protein [Chloroflexota bacterium]
MFGNDSIWVNVPRGGVTTGSPQDTGGAFDKFGTVDLLAGGTPVVDVRRLDGASPPAEIDVTGVWTSGGSLYIVAVLFPTTGCWEITERVETRQVRFVVWIADPRGRTSPQGSSEGCDRTQFVATKPDDPNSASFTDTWYSNATQTRWAGLDRGHEGRWVSAHVMKVLWVKPVNTALEAEATRLGQERQVASFVTSAAGYFSLPYQASGIELPSAGCWRIDGSAGPENLSFLVLVEAQ